MDDLDNLDMFARIPVTFEEVERAALSDPDAQPLTDSDFRRMKQSPRSRIVRRALHLAQKMPEINSRPVPYGPGEMDQ